MAKRQFSDHDGTSVPADSQAANVLSLLKRRRITAATPGECLQGAQDNVEDKKSKKDRSKEKKPKKKPVSPTQSYHKEAILDRDAAKAAKKVEKARLKALRKTSGTGVHADDRNKLNGHGNNDGDFVEIVGYEDEDLLSQAAAEAAINTEKARLKAPKNTKKEETNITTFAPVTSLSYTEDPRLMSLPQSGIDAFLSSNFITIIDPTASRSLRPIISFSHLPATAITKPSPFATFKNPTPIQSAAWPFLFSGRDVIGVAETGSGKTLAFGVPCIRYISSLPKEQKRSSAARAVIVSPTRELAVQIHEQIIQLAILTGLKSVCVYGGVPKEAQRAALRTAHIVVATPGRLNDLINEGSADLGSVGYLVLDEADRMLDKGFEDEIRKIISTTRSPTSSIENIPGRQTLMFTATWPPSIRELAATFMRSPVKIAIGDNPTGELRANTRILQRVEVIDPRIKEMRLLQLIKQHQSGKLKDDRILVFCLYKKEATRVEWFLRSKGLRVVGIHGDLSQEKRTASLEAFKKDMGTPLLVATDVAARGLDIPDVKVVINVTFPLTVEDYVHRIGRTGRAGAEGLAITLFTEHDKARSGELINVLRAAGQPVPDDLLRFGTTVKKKGHDAYGAFYKEKDNTKRATKVKFDD